MKRNAPDPQDVERFQNAVDHRLSGLREDPYLARRIIAGGMEEKKVKKRMTLGLVMALTLILAGSAVMAENWPAVSDYLASGMPDLVAQDPANGNGDPEKKDLPLDNSVVSTTEAAPLSYGKAPAAYWYTLLFGTPYTIHYTDQDGTACDYTNDACTNMIAYFNRTQFEILEDFGKKNGPVETDLELLILGGSSSDVAVTFQMIEKPTVTAFYQQDGYTVRFTGGKFRVMYPTDLYYSPEAYKTIGNGVWQFNPTPDTIVRAEYVAEEYPYNFTFHLYNMNNYHTSEVFGSGLAPVTQHYFEADGTEKTWEQDNDRFEAILQEHAIASAVDFSRLEKGVEAPLAYRESFLTFSGFPETQFTILETPQCAVTLLPDGYSLRLSGGLLRIRYKSQMWRQETEDGSILMLNAPDGIETYATVEIPFDFTFTAPIYENVFPANP